MQSGFDDTLVLNQDDHVSEDSAANFMIMRDGNVAPMTQQLHDLFFRVVTGREESTCTGYHQYPP